MWYCNFYHHNIVGRTQSVSAYVVVLQQNPCSLFSFGDICCIVKLAPKELTRPGRFLMFSSAWYPVYDPASMDEGRVGPVTIDRALYSQVMVGAGFEPGSAMLRSNTDRSQHLDHSAMCHTIPPIESLRGSESSESHIAMSRSVRYLRAQPESRVNNK